MPKKVERQEVLCPCGKTFAVAPWKIKAGRGKRCSKECQYKYPTRPKGLTYEIKVENRAWFKKGQEPLHKIQRGERISPETQIKPGQRLSPETEFKKGKTSSFLGKERPELQGDKHWAWKGNEAGYQALHSWVRRHKEKTGLCAHCGQVKKTQWANKSHEYKRDLDDWLELCGVCHRRHDSGPSRGSAKRKYGMNGEKN